MNCLRRDEARKRLADAVTVAGCGLGWDALQDLWKVSKPAAFSWVRTNAPREVFLQIGQNGRNQRRGRVLNVGLRAEVATLRDQHSKPFREIAEIVNVDIHHVHRIYYQTKRTGAPQVASVYTPKPIADLKKMSPVEKSPPNEFCQRKWLDLDTHKLAQCNEPTENGAAYCSGCRDHLITCLDRTPPQEAKSLPAPRQHPWNEAALAGAKAKQPRNWPKPEHQHQERNAA